MPEANEEIKIGNTKISESTELRINLKTLAIVLGLLISGLGSAYYKLDQSITTTKTEIIQKIKKVEDSVDKLEDSVHNTEKTTGNIQITSNSNVDRIKSIDTKVDAIQFRLIPQASIPSNHSMPNNIPQAIH